jgi:thiol-disulfide isomerase/thioredoxin
MSFENNNIVYLENSDFNGSVLMYNNNPLESGKFMIMVQADYCGYCKQAKPAFSAAADSIGTLDLNKGVIFATIHSDSPNPAEAALGKNLSKISGINLRGIPAFLLYDAKTKKFTQYDGPRTTNGIVDFLATQS